MNCFKIKFDAGALFFTSRPKEADDKMNKPTISKTQARYKNILSTPLFDCIFYRDTPCPVFRFKNTTFVKAPRRSKNKSPIVSLKFSRATFAE